MKINVSVLSGQDHLGVLLDLLDSLLDSEEKMRPKS